MRIELEGAHYHNLRLFVRDRGQWKLLCYHSRTSDRERQVSMLRSETRSGIVGSELAISRQG